MLIGLERESPSLLCQRPPRETLARWEAYLFTYLWALTALFYAHSVRIGKSTELHWEEASVAFRNVVCLIDGRQSTPYSTVFSEYVFHWIGYLLDGTSISSPRIWAIVVVASTSPLLVALARRVAPNLSWWSSLMPAVVFPLIPNVSWIGILANSMNHLPFSILALCLALDFDWKWERKKRLTHALVIAVVLAWVLHFYSTSFVTIAAVLLTPLLKYYWLPKPQRPSLKLVAASYLLWCSLIVVLSCWPFLVYKSRPLVMFTGGGRFEGTFEAIQKNMWANYSDFFVRSLSYIVTDMKFAAFPWPRTGFLMVLLWIIGLTYSYRRYPAVLLLVIWASFSFAITIAASHQPGIRRALELVAALCLLMGIGIEAIIRSEKRVITFPLLVLVVSCGVVCVWGSSNYVFKTGMFSLALLAVWMLCGESNRAMRIRYTALVTIPFAALITFIDAYGWVDDNYKRPSLPSPYTVNEELPFRQEIESMILRMKDERFPWNPEKMSWDYIIMTYMICEKRYGDCKRPFQSNNKLEVKCIGR